MGTAILKEDNRENHGNGKRCVQPFPLAYAASILSTNSFYAELRPKRRSVPVNGHTPLEDTVEEWRSMHQGDTSSVVIKQK